MDGSTHGHTRGSSSSLMETAGFAQFINKIQTYPQWNDTVVFVQYDDWGGHYDHVAPPIKYASHCALDMGDTRGSFLSNPMTMGSLGNGSAFAGKECRGGYGFRSPFVAIGPWVKENYIDHMMTDTTSVLRFIEDNWLNGQRIGGESLDQFNLPETFLVFSMFTKKNMRYVFLDPIDGSPDLVAHV